MRLLADMPISPLVAGRLRDRGHDVTHASELGLARASDRQIVDRARSDSRAVLTEDLDFPAILALSGAREPSVLLLRVGPWDSESLAERVLEVIDACSHRLANAIVVIERTRVRIHTLPIRRDIGAED